MSKAEFAVFTQEPPVIEIKDRIVVVRYRSGKDCIERAMSIRTLARIVERGKEALRRHATGDEHIVIDE
jgi:NaMN:DMB phosphoribosyltransferase